MLFCSFFWARCFKFTRPNFLERMLAQRWEKPSTGQEERRAILRARKLCEEITETTTSDDPASGVSYPQHQEGNREIRYFDFGTTFLSSMWIFGVQPSLIAQLLESIPASLMNAAIFLEDTLNLVQMPIPRHELERSTTGPFTQSSSHMSVIYRWNPDTMIRTCVEASPAFCRCIAGMEVAEFNKKIDSNEFPLPCSPLQYLLNFLDGSLCIGEGLTSWTRSVIIYFINDHHI